MNTASKENQYMSKRADISTQVQVNASNCSSFLLIAAIVLYTFTLADKLSQYKNGKSNTGVWFTGWSTLYTLHRVGANKIYEDAS